MQIQLPQHELDILRTKVPIESLGRYGLRHLPEFASIQYCGKDAVLFCAGDQDRESIFILKGEVELRSPDGRVSRIGASDERARYALSNLKPRRFTCVAVLPDVVAAHIQTETLERVLGWEQAGYSGSSDTVIVEDGTDGHTWLVAMLATREFHRLPVATLEILLDRLEEIQVEEGTQIIRQGQPGDFYYIVVRGRVLVQRETPKGEIALAELTEGQSFGEQALITGFHRNANVIALEDCTLKRLSAKNFQTLLLAPLIKWVSAHEANILIREGAVPVDVRTENEFAQSPKKNAINIPLFLLHLKIHKLKRDRRYVLFFDNGARSSAAAFMLSRHNMESCVLQGGLESHQKHKDRKSISSNPDS